jgi:hypothetical protein
MHTAYEISCFKIRFDELVGHTLIFIYIMFTYTAINKFELPVATHGHLTSYFMS